ncbi:hypothetical protein [Ruegeria arenilitoris]|uniref:hypothetical protein n=1 Tax=Ruegeria arenilitoris TaxID=1173585 RepID=UPI0014813F40|nr:hypothetical protein [Ruegeria arenilitoris]
MSVLLIVAGISAICIANWSEKVAAREAIMREFDCSADDVTSSNIAIFRAQNKGQEAASALTFIGLSLLGAGLGSLML